MRKHHNPYLIRDSNNLLEVGENSSHPELDDARRIWKFHSYTFQSATEVERFFNSEGLDLSQYDYRPKKVREFAKNLIIIEIVSKTALPMRESSRRVWG